jgi:hypothetical protein
LAAHSKAQAGKAHGLAVTVWWFVACGLCVDFACGLSVLFPSGKKNPNRKPDLVQMYAKTTACPARPGFFIFFPLGILKLKKI